MRTSINIFLLTFYCCGLSNAPTLSVQRPSNECSWMQNLPFVFNSVVPVCRVYGGTEFVCHRLPWRRYRYISGNNADSVNGSLIRGRFTTAYAC